MTFEEWVEVHGIESARSWFKLGDHMVFVQHDGYVEGVCGKWRGSQPIYEDTPEVAMDMLRKAVCNCFATEEIIIG